MCTSSQLGILVLLEVLILYVTFFAVGWCRSQSVCRNVTGVTTTTTNAQQALIFGYVHVAKTGGTELNGELAAQFERVCGHKGYSYNAFQINRRFNNFSQIISRKNDSTSKVMFRNGAWVPKKIMDEIGYEDCDYVSFEFPWESWSRFNSWDVPMELHVPCRDPVDHLMSSCNHKERVFDCNAHNLDSEIMKCLLPQNRFSPELETSFDNIHLKCFDFQNTFTDYIEYMGERLQRKRIQAQYVHRDTNRPRNKTNECVWNSDVFEVIKAYLVENYDYYSYCSRCIGSGDDLFA